MEGLPERLQGERFGARLSSASLAAQRTLRAAISCVGVGLHSGNKVRLTLHPADADSGIIVRRTDLGITLPARFDHVVDTRLCTVLGLPGRPEVRVGTVEHVMAALAGMGVHNAVLEVDGPEMPILDGSARDFVFLIECAGVVEQDALVPVVEVHRPVRVELGEGYAELRPSAHGFDMSASIVFDAPAVGRQALTLRLGAEAFRNGLAAARTFTFAEEVERLTAAGLARGGSLENALVVDGDKVLNPGGLRMADEFIRHKLLDAVGDLALAGAVLRGRYVAHRPGHALNNQLLRALFADSANWGFAPRPEVLTGWQSRLPAAAAA